MRFQSFCMLTMTHSLLRGKALHAEHGDEHLLCHGRRLADLRLC